MRIPPFRAIALALAALIVVSGFLTLSNSSTMAKWAQSSSSTAVPLNYGTMGLTFTEYKRVLPYFSITNPKTFGQAVTPVEATISSGAFSTTSSEVTAFLRGTHNASYEPSFAGQLRVYGYNNTTCALGSQAWVTSAGTYNSSTPTAPIKATDGTSPPTAFPVPSTASVSRCLRMITGLSERELYEWWAGREFNITLKYNLTTPGDASWNGTTTYTAKYVIPIPPPVPSTSGVCADGGDDVTIYWRWPDQKDSSSNHTTGIDHWNIYGRLKGASTWTYLDTVASGTRSKYWSSYFDLSTKLKTNGDYQLRVVGFAFNKTIDPQESKFMAGSYFWNVKKTNDWVWNCNYTTPTTPSNEGPGQYDVAFPTFPNLLSTVKGTA